MAADFGRKLVGMIASAHAMPLNLAINAIIATHVTRSFGRAVIMCDHGIHTSCVMPKAQGQV